MHHLTNELQQVLKMTAKCLNSTNQKWLLGGSCSLILQEVKVHIPPRDIDLYADAKAVEMLHTAIKKWSVDEQELNKEGLYSSILSHYVLNDAQIELVGDFRISSNTFEYSVKVEDTLWTDAPEIELDGVQMCLTPLSHELIFNMLRERIDRYEAIAMRMREELEKHLPLLEKLVRHHWLEENQILLIAKLLEAPTLLRYMSKR
ncbi:hypothetical protein [Paenibacillus crassostreae]|uniref:Nucleotidyl transferase AbiEii/AbiGii toxin family protein n=1 Tax=Paenibacillus crassostreae TaxID=1763538 RepID=A0A167DJQ4_9BACL|nr:hypothetical protein [Paenibacillus crassostreae]AOZ91381.1 hypothetical protein LPB68_03610 [Paenibacillus crassostreae]OAB74460.1 hypothetical protein PNBC_10350 [Paenibacillus crassostreae]